MKVLVYGWYHQGNVGDDLFVEAYHYLFPDLDFSFTEELTSSQLENVDAVFFGGGSFLLDAPRAAPETLDLIKSKKIFYLGVGVELDIHPIHLELMSRAEMIATRTPGQIERLRAINSNVSYIPDLVYSLQSKVKLSDKKNKSVLIMPNIEVLPQRSEPYWKHAAWSYFKSEFTQFLDFLVEDGYHLTMFSMCHATKLEDDWAAAELIGHMDQRNVLYNSSLRLTSIEDITQFISSFELIITQRFHGIVLAEMTKTPYIAIHHHDKLKFSWPKRGVFISYYNSSKRYFTNAFEQAIKMQYTNTLPVETAIFETFTKEVMSLI